MLREGELLPKQYLERGGKAKKSNWACGLGEPAAFGCALTTKKASVSNPSSADTFIPTSFHPVEPQGSQAATKPPKTSFMLRCKAVSNSPFPVTGDKQINWDLQAKCYQYKHRLMLGASHCSPLLAEGLVGQFMVKTHGYMAHIFKLNLYKWHKLERFLKNVFTKSTEPKQSVLITEQQEPEPLLCTRSTPIRAWSAPGIWYLTAPRQAEAAPQLICLVWAASSPSFPSHLTGTWHTGAVHSHKS